MVDTYNVILFPEVREGKDAADVKKKLVTALKTNEKKVESWFQSDKPTIILKAVNDETAEKYLRAIIACGAVCQVRSTSETINGMHLVPKHAGTADLFICPSCEHEMKIKPDEDPDQCPKCGLVIAKWREKVMAERQKGPPEADAKETEEEERRRKLEELEEVRQKEREIMDDLGMRLPGPFSRLFRRFPIGVGMVLTILIAALTAAGMYYGNQRLEAEKRAKLLAAQPSQQMNQAVPLMSAAVDLRRTGNEQMLTETARVVRTLHGNAPEEKKRLVKAAQQMMKGVGSDKFLEIALKPPAIPARTIPAEGEEQGAAVNLDTIGRIGRLTGVDRFKPGILKQMVPALLEHGHEEVLAVMVEKTFVPDPENPDGPSLVVEQIDKLDGSMIVDLMQALEKDQEWDQFLLGHVNDLLRNYNVEEASGLANRVRNPVLRVDALGNIMAHVLEQGGTEESLGPYIARIDAELKRILEPDLKAMATLSLGRKLASAGSEVEPDNSMNLVRNMLNETSDPYEKAFLSSRLAIAHLHHGDKPTAYKYFDQAVDLAGQVASKVGRLSAFARIAGRFYDARNTPLANKILADVAVLAATQLEPADRSRIFGEIAMAQGYMGDFEGAMISIENAGQSAARQQLLSRLAEFLIGLDKPFLAQSVMARITDPVEINRLELRFISAQLHGGDLQEAKDRLFRAEARAREIESLSERGLILSQYARLFVRSGQEERAKQLFDEALEISATLEGRKSSINRGLVALDQARALMLKQSRDVIAEVTESIVREPIDSQILEVERVLETFMPELLETAAKSNTSDWRTGYQG